VLGEGLLGIEPRRACTRVEQQLVDHPFHLVHRHPLQRLGLQRHRDYQVWIHLRLDDARRRYSQ
jgi:hypothetical protein